MTNRMSNVQSLLSTSLVSACTDDGGNTETSAGVTVDSRDSTLLALNYESTQQGNDSLAVASEISKLSKNQQKKLRRKQAWEANKEARKARRKEKIKIRKQKKREIATSELDQVEVEHEKSAMSQSLSGERLIIKSLQDDPQSVQIPIAFVIDCQFDDLMLEHEMVSLAGQITRCYSDNRKARYRAHLAISSFSGNLKARFENTLSRSHESWKGVQFFEEDFVQVAHMMKSYMTNFREDAETDAFLDDEVSSREPNFVESGEVVYLSSESPNVLTELRRYDTYVVGGLVDHNRHKGICFKRAGERKIRTAKLPIGEFLNMQGRSVLATNHVVEIMLKWLELHDWGQAFMQVIPKRKGMTLK